eukprot:TRINITY_DN2359_c0_g1_i1.p1 TRINITY_DN2359_c0_g1~~TRINITY_DN2359_c0_g1_i1.p1  ORF type:complete len:544 (-),score=96.76 TRINITY_DN2359_c0_g1_i1:185-1816(-)
MARVMKKHLDVLELHERLRPLYDYPSFCREPNPSRSQVKEVLSFNQVTQYLLHYLKEQGLDAARASLERETKIKYSEEFAPLTSLSALISPALVTSEVFDPLNAIEPDPVDDEVYLSNFRSDLDAEDDVNIWDEGPDTLTNITFESVRGTTLLQTGSLNKLVTWLTSENSTGDSKFRNVFLLCYPTFTTAPMVLRKLIERYSCDPSTLKTEEDKKNLVAIQTRVVRLIKQWIDSRHGDWTDQLTETVKLFINNKLLPNQHHELVKLLSTSISRMDVKQSEGTLLKVSTFPEVKVPKNIFSPSLSLDEIHEEEIARQLTLIDYSIYTAIQPIELLQNSITKDYSPKVTEMIQRFNEISFWVATSIIDIASAKNRATIVTKFINIADHLRAMNSFNTLIGIISGLTCHPIRRLKFTFRELSPASRNTLNELILYVDLENDFLRYKQTLHELNGTCVPYIGIHLRDLVIINETFPNMEKKLINFKKRRYQYAVVSSVLRFQKKPYAFHSIQQIQRFLVDLSDCVVDEIELYKVSTMVEPRGATSVN